MPPLSIVPATGGGDEGGDIWLLLNAALLDHLIETLDFVFDPDIPQDVVIMARLLALRGEQVQEVT